MLERVRKALGRGPNGPLGTPHRGFLVPLGPVMPPIAPGEALARFESEWQKVAGETHRAATMEELEKLLQGILAPSRTPSVVLSRNPLLARLRIAERLRAWGKPVALWPLSSGAVGKNESASLGEFRAASFEAGVGITGVEFVLAESGTLVLSSRTEGSQLASLAPPVHVAIYRRSQVVASLDEVLDKIASSCRPGEPRPGRSVVFVTGPSRTADIEQILVRGVHGPREVHAVLVEDSCLL